MPQYRHSISHQLYVCACKQEVEQGRLSVRADTDMYSDVGIRQGVIDLLMSYHPAWLRLGLETVAGEVRLRAYLYRLPLCATKAGHDYCTLELLVPKWQCSAPSNNDVCFLFAVRLCPSLARTRLCLPLPSSLLRCDPLAYSLFRSLPIPALVIVESYRCSDFVFVRSVCSGIKPPRSSI
jgi:hypothetical protein